MANTTATLGLSLPTEAENYDVNVTNRNMETIDMAFSELAQGINDGQTALGDKMDAVQQTANRNAETLAALTQALATANANIATLLTQTGGVKAIISGTHKFESRDWSTTIPDTVNPDKVVIITSSGMSDAQSTTNGVVWTKTGSTVKFTAYVGHQVAYQFVEFY